MSHKNPILLIDLGSSSVKIYEYSGGNLSTIGYKTIQFKDGFNEADGLIPENEEQLLSYLKPTGKKYRDVPIHIYATALYRKMSPSAFDRLRSMIKNDVGAELHLVSHDQENEYLEHAVLGKYSTDDPILMVNVGGGSTEIVLVKNGATHARYNVDIGVGTVLSMFKNINDFPPKLSQDEMLQDVLTHLPTIEENPRVAFVTGGELTWMTLGEYPLEDNMLFTDTDHPKMIDVKKYLTKNKEIYHSMSLEALQRLMPENPGWMVGAKAYNVISDAVCTRYKLETLIPSDSNLIHGVVRKDFA